MEIIDCDVHMRWKSIEEIAPYLDEPYRTHLRKGRRPYTYAGYYNPIGTRKDDAEPPNGGSPGSDPDFLAEDLLDRYGICYAVLMGEASQLGFSNMTDPNWAIALAGAHNDWLINHWFQRDKRFVGSVFVAAQEPEGSAREIDRVGVKVYQVIIQDGQVVLEIS